MKRFAIITSLVILTSILTYGQTSKDTISIKEVFSGSQFFRATKY